MKKTANANAIPQHSRSYAEMKKIIDAERGELRSEYLPPGCSKWPLELVVRTAASLHKEGDEFDVSAERAMWLIAACVETLEAFSETDNVITVEENQVFFSEKFGVPPSKIKNDRLKFSDAIKVITSQKVKSRAEADFTEVLFAWFGNDRSQEGKAKVVKEYGRYEREGLDLCHIENLHSTYEDLRESGALGKRRRPKKNDLPGRHDGKLDMKTEKLNASNPVRDI